MKKNYIKLSIILIITVILTLITCNLYRNYDGNKLNSSYISKYVSNIKYNELTSFIPELTSNNFIYISYVGDKNIYNFEKSLKKELYKLELQENLYLVDVTDKINDNKIINNLNKDILINENIELVLPVIIYYQDNKAIDYIDSSEGMLDIGKFSQLLDKYELGSNNA